MPFSRPIVKPWARGRRFWNLYTQLGLRLCILVTYIVCLGFLLHGSRTVGASYILGYTMVGVSIFYNGGHVKRLHQLLVVERRPGQHKADVGCVICLEVAAIITTALVGLGVLIVDGEALSSSECSPYDSEICIEKNTRRRDKGQYAFYASRCLWAASGLHFFLLIIVSVQCCINKGLDMPQSATGTSRLRAAGPAVGYNGDREQGRGRDDDHELPAYRPRDSSAISTRISEEPPAYVARSPSIERMEHPARG